MKEIIENFLNPDWIGVILAGLAFLVSIFSNIQSSKANSISKEANDKAEKSNEIAKDALETAKEQLEMSIRDRMSHFKVKLINIGFFNDGYACEEMKEALTVGTAKCIFEIENTSDKYATSVKFEKFDDDGLDIGLHEKVKLNYIIQLRQVDFYNPEMKLPKRNMYKLEKKCIGQMGLLISHV